MRFGTATNIMSLISKYKTKSSMLSIESIRKSFTRDGNQRNQ